ncbi:MAG: hypothetical protein IPK13_02530 [Deltaproteobacteria bacterium]|nr:hypothetical protein [Deltaproteobacteria bacterium]
MRASPAYPKLMLALGWASAFALLGCRVGLNPRDDTAARLDARANSDADTSADSGAEADADSDANGDGHVDGEGYGGADADAGTSGGEDADVGTDAEVGSDAEVSDAAYPIVIEPMFPSNGRNWNDYVVRDALRIEDNSDASACVSGPTSFRDCIHAGERLVARLDGITTCEGVVPHDELRAFAWSCFIRNGLAHAYSTGLAKSRGLSDLINATGWRGNRLFVSVLSPSSTILSRFETPPGIWWSNPVRPVGGQSNTMRLTEAGAIYAVSTSTTGAGFSLEADRVAFVVRRGAKYTFQAPSDSNCRASTGEMSGADSLCTLTAGGQHSLWIEGTFGTSASSEPYYHLQLISSSRVRISHVSLNSATKTCVRIDAGGGHVVRDLRGALCGSTGLEVGRTQAPSLFTDVRIHRPAVGVSSAIQAVRNAADVWQGIFTSGTYSGLYFNAAQNQTVTRVVSSNANWGSELNAGGRLTLHHATMAANSHLAIAMFGTPTHMFLGQLAAFDNAYGLTFVFTDSTVFHSAITHSLNRGFDLRAPSARNAFRGVLVAGSNNPDCFVEGGLESPGLIHGTCTDTGLEGSSRYTGQASDAVLRFDSAPDAALIGPVFVDDPSNASDVDGLQSETSIIDWVNMESPYRMWGKEGGRGACSGTCRIYDWRLRPDSGSPLWNRSGDGAIENDPFVPGTPCPSAADGNRVAEDRQSFDHTPWTNAVEILDDGLGDDDEICEVGEKCHNRFLINALEILYDDKGDDDGLCESDEACTYSPHIGAYQGEGNPMLEASCAFSNGRVRNVELRHFPACPESAPVSIARGGFFYNRALRLWQQRLYLTNKAASEFSLPVYIVFGGLSSNTTLINADGLTRCVEPTEAPFIIVETNGWLPEEQRELDLRFQKDDAGAITYDVRVLTGSSSP